MQNLPKDKHIILFDGVCNLCNSSVNSVIDKDKNDLYRFTSLQEEVGQEIQKYLGINTIDLDSIILYIPEEAYYTKSDAALKVLSSFGGLWKVVNIFYIIPKPIRNFVYDFVARNRYKWYGKSDNCRIPTPELKSKFL